MSRLLAYHIYNVSERKQIEAQVKRNLIRIVQQTHEFNGGVSGRWSVLERNSLCKELWDLTLCRPSIHTTHHMKGRTPNQHNRASVILWWGLQLVINKCFSFSRFW